MAALVGNNVLSIRDLRVHYPTDRGTIRAVRGLSLDVREGEILGLVGESGCGKTATMLAAMRLIPHPGRMVSGSITLDGRDLLSLSGGELRKMRGSTVSMVFQDPMSALNPAHKVGAQLSEVLAVHGHRNLAESKEHLKDLLRQVGIPSPESVLGYYPHQLSGGMQQRVMIAIALACKPKLILADEPTTALDVTIEAQILDLLRDINRENGTSIVLVTHNLAVASQFCNRIAVMYAGQIVEEGPITDVLADPFHPYTQGLIRCIPSFTKKRLSPIPGQVPDLLGTQTGCVFYPRCIRRSPDCRHDDGNDLISADDGRQVRCRNWGSVKPEEESEAIDRELAGDIDGL